MRIPLASVVAVSSAEEKHTHHTPHNAVVISQHRYGGEAEAAGAAPARQQPSDQVVVCRLRHSPMDSGL